MSAYDCCGGRRKRLGLITPRGTPVTVPYMSVTIDSFEEIESGSTINVRALDGSATAFLSIYVTNLGTAVLNLVQTDDPLNYTGDISNPSTLNPGGLSLDPNETAYFSIELDTTAGPKSGTVTILEDGGTGIVFTVTIQWEAEPFILQMTGASVGLNFFLNGGHPTPVWTLTDADSTVTNYNTGNFFHNFSGATTALDPHILEFNSACLPYVTDMPISEAGSVGFLDPLPPPRGGMVDLVYLEFNLPNNTGELPPFDHLPLLSLLRIGNSNLTGRVPRISSLLSLTTLEIYNCPNLTGSLATFVGLLNNLDTIFIDNTGLGGTLPSLEGTVISSLVFTLSALKHITDLKAPALADLNLSDNGMSQEDIDFVLQKLYEERNNYTDASPIANLAGSNAAPSGVYADEDPPVTGQGYRFELENDPETEGFNQWTITVS